MTSVARPQVLARLQTALRRSPVVMMMRRSDRIGFEFKYADAPSTTRSMRRGMDDLGLSRLYVVYPGRVAYTMAEGIDAVPVQDLAALGLG